MKRQLAALLAVFLLGILCCLLLSTARRTSLVYDEVIYAPAGVMYLKTGDYRWNPEHPPLQKLLSAIPWVAKGVNVPPDLDPVRVDAWRMGYRIFFQNNFPAQTLIFLARLPTILLTLLLALLIFLFVLKRAGWEAAAVSLAAFAFDPLVIGNGALAMNDMFVTFFVFSAVLAFQHWTKKKFPLLWAVITGALTGAAIASKFSGLLLISIFCFHLWRLYPSRKIAWSGLFAGTATGLLVLLACYQFNVHYLISALRAGAAIHEAAGKSGYLLGPIPGASGWFYYPIAALIKTPIALLVLWGVSLFKSALVLPVALFWIAALVSRNHFGIRYLLPATPFLAVMVGLFYSSLKIKIEKRAYWALLLWLAIETMATHPHHMAYFNELIGGPKNGSKWLDGSNQDWGQDLPSLAALIEKQNPKPSILMGYWGSNQPEAWGIEYQDVLSPAITNSFRRETINPLDAGKEWLVVSAELRHNPATKEAYAWLNDKTPIAFPGSTLFVYDITNDLDSVLGVAAIYKVMGRNALYERQMARAKRIQKQLLIEHPVNHNTRH